MADRCIFNLSSALGRQLLHGRSCVKALSKAVMIVTTDVELDWQGEYERWIVEQYLPRMMEISGFLSAEPCAAVTGGPKYMAFFQIASADIANSQSVALVAETAGALGGHITPETSIYEQIFPEEGVVQGAEWSDGNRASGSVLLNRFNVLPDYDQEFNDWYNQEHLPWLATVPGSISNRRFRARRASRLYLARYDLVNPHVPTTEEWRKVVATPWTRKMQGVWRDPWRTLFVPLSQPLIAGS
jgi:hypothetical protein